MRQNLPRSACNWHRVAKSTFRHGPTETIWHIWLAAVRQPRRAMSHAPGKGRATQDSSTAKHHTWARHDQIEQINNSHASVCARTHSRATADTNSRRLTPLHSPWTLRRGMLHALTHTNHATGIATREKKNLVHMPCQEREYRAQYLGRQANCTETFFAHSCQTCGRHFAQV